MKRMTVMLIAGAMSGIMLTGCGDKAATPEPAEAVTEVSEATETVKETEALESSAEAASNSEEKNEDKRRRFKGKPEEDNANEQASKEESTDYEALYEPVFSEILEIIDYGYNMDREYTYASGNLTDAIDYGSVDKPLDEIGYRLEDMSGDGIPELLIGYDADYLHNGGESYISGVYTIKDGKPFTAYAGSARSSCQRMDDTHFFSSYSGGTSFTVMGMNHLSYDGTEIVWDDCYFTDEKNDGTVGYYHNKTGVVDSSKADEMSEEIFIEIIDDCEYNCIKIEWIPIGKCAARKGSGESSKTTGSTEADDEGELYCGVLYWYKELQDSGKSAEEMDKYSDRTQLIQHGWPNATDNNEIRYVYKDITGDGYDELIITYFNDPVDIYANYGDAVYAYGVPYRGIANIYPDGTIMEGLSAGTKGWIETWYKYDEKTYKYVSVKGKLNPEMSNVIFTGGKKISDVVVPESLRGFTDSEGH